MIPTNLSTPRLWIGVDLDGTLAQYDHWRGVEHIGDPVPKMVDRVKQWVAAGVEVRIFTARAGIPGATAAVERWLTQQGIGGLAITNVKDFGMIELWDDRAIQVVSNTGIPIVETFQDVGSGRVAASTQTR
jgi:hypothetical protein